MKKPGAKTPGSVRSIAIQDWLVDHLDAYRERFPGGDRELIFRAPGGGNGKGRGHGGIIVNNHFNRMLK